MSTKKYFAENIAKIWGGNTMRVLQQVIDYAKNKRQPEISIKYAILQFIIFFLKILSWGK
jgi:hypothetical protein